MALFDFLFPRLPAPLSVVDPYAAPDSMAPIIVSEIFGEETAELLPIDRVQALTIPAVQGVQNFISAALGRLQLTASRGGTPIADQPAFLTRTNRVEQPVYLRNVRTMLDFAFTGYSLWQRHNGADGSPLYAWHVPFTKWSFDDEGFILIDEKRVESNEVIFFESMVPGLLNYSPRTLRGALAVEHTVEERAKLALPVTVLKDDPTNQLMPEEIEEVKQDWADARKGKNGAVAYVSTLAVETVDEPVGAWLLDARNAYIADIAKATLIPSALLEGTSSIDSLTYATEIGQLARFVQVSSRLYTDPIEARLSMSDVTPNGQTVAFDRAPLNEIIAAAQATSKETNG